MKFTNTVRTFVVFIFNTFNLNMSLIFEFNLSLPSALCGSTNLPSSTVEISDVALTVKCVVDEGL
jgi:hypothetical protein